MKFTHRNIAEAIVESLELIFLEHKYADRVVEKTLKSNSKWGSRDRRMIAENTYNIVRWWRLLHFYADTDFENPTSESIWKVFGIWLTMSEIELPDWAEFTTVANVDFTKKESEAQLQPKVLHSFPDWINTIGEKELATNWVAEMKALNQPASVVLRTNTLKLSKEKLKKILSESQIETEEIAFAPQALLLTKRQNLAQHPLYVNGSFEIQDTSSQLVSQFLDPKPNEIVIDACAGAGGKSLHLAALMENKGTLVSMDIEANKLTELSKRAKRGGVKIINTSVIKDAYSLQKLYNSADKVLLDVPCTGLGVIRRNPDAKWKLTPTFLAEIIQKQQQILKEYTLMAKVGGTIVYATCSILPSENENQIKLFLDRNSDFEFVEQKIIPATSGQDGFYMAKIKRVK